MVGKFYEKGFGIDKNINIAIEWYMEASQKNEINGHYESGNAYYIKGNLEKGFEFYQLAIIDGLNIALHNFAYCCEIGNDGIEKMNLVHLYYTV